jgi:hypothetical protein
MPINSTPAISKIEKVSETDTPLSLVTTQPSAH